MTDQQNNIKNMTFEQALSELEDIVRTLESGNQELDSSISKYERGTALKGHCESKLKDAQLKVEKLISQQENGEITTEPTKIETSANG